MKRKAIKPFIRYIRLGYGVDTQPWAEVLQELGYILYSNPVEDGGVFISNIPLTENWLFDNAKKFGIKLRGWKAVDGEDELDEVW